MDCDWGVKKTSAKMASLKTQQLYESATLICMYRAVNKMISNIMINNGEHTPNLTC